MIFNRLALAVTFSPNSKSNLLEVKRLQELFQAELFLIHIGEKNIEKENLLNELISSCNMKKNDFNLIWKDGDVEDLIMDICIENKIDLLIAGALRKENLFKYYLGSVARTLMREAPCSVLFLMNKDGRKQSYKKICVSVDFSKASEFTVLTSYEIAKLENAEKLTLIREFELPALASTIYESNDNLNIRKNLILQEEKEKMNIFKNELNLIDISVDTECLFGKQGWEVSNWVLENKYDLLVIPSLNRKPKLIDRIFQHDWEFIFKELHSSLLIIKTENS